MTSEFTPSSLISQFVLKISRGKKILLFNMKLMLAKIPSECEEIYNYIFTHSLSFFAVKFLLSLISVLSTKMLKPDIIMMQTLRFWELIISHKLVSISYDEKFATSLLMLLHQFAICICKLVHRDWEIIEFFLEEWKNLSNL